VLFAYNKKCTIKEQENNTKIFRGINPNGRVTRCVCEKAAQNIAQSISFESYVMHNFYRAIKSSPIICAISVIFTKPTQRKQSPKTAKIRPIWDRCYDFLKIFAEKICKKIGVFDSKQS
jgi:hypothetical protein